MARPWKTNSIESTAGKTTARGMRHRLRGERNISDEHRNIGLESTFGQRTFDTAVEVVLNSTPPDMPTKRCVGCGVVSVDVATRKIPNNTGTGLRFCREISPDLCPECFGMAQGRQVDFTGVLETGVEKPVQTVAEKLLNVAGARGSGVSVVEFSSVGYLSKQLRTSLRLKK